MGVRANGRLALLAFDADDTLWVNEPLYTRAQDRLKEVVSPYIDDAWVGRALYATEMRNLALFGYSAKSFTLSMIETAIELSAGTITGREIRQILNIGKGLLNEPISLLPGVQETIPRLAAGYELMLVTKGDLLDQNGKLARSGMSDLFQYIEIVSEKDEATYSKILERHAVEAARFLMVGNSLRSDVMPVLNIGGHAVHIPYHETWQHEHVSGDDMSDHAYFRLENIRELPALLEREF